MERSAKARSGRRERDSAATRTAILAAARAEFAKAGLAGARTDVIAARAGVNKALLYYYFKSKEALFEAVLVDLFGEFNRQALEVLASPGSARVVLLRYVSLHFDFLSTHHRHASLHQQAMASRGRFAKRLVAEYFVPRAKAFGELLQRGVQEGEFRPMNCFHTALSIVAVVVFYFSAARVLELMDLGDLYGEARLQERKREVLEFVRYSVFANPALPLPSEGQMASSK
jgi:TetR/AcrR family transcriptional regulator